MLLSPGWLPRLLHLVLQGDARATALLRPPAPLAGARGPPRLLRVSRCWCRFATPAERGYGGSGAACDSSWLAKAPPVPLAGGGGGGGQLLQQPTTLHFGPVSLEDFQGAAGRALWELPRPGGFNPNMGWWQEYFARHPPPHGHK